MAVQDDAQLAAAARAGDREAFGAIVARYQERIVRHLTRLTGDPDLALDLAQDTFVAAYRGISRQREDAALAAWLFRIATNRALDRLRRRRLLRWLRLDAAPEPAAADPAEAYPAQAAVRRALAALRPEDRACLLLALHEGMTHGEVGVALGISPEAARKRVARARAAFHAAYLREVGE